MCSGREYSTVEPVKSKNRAYLQCVFENICATVPAETDPDIPQTKLMRLYNDAETGLLAAY